MNKKLLAAALGLAFAAPVFADSSNVVLYGRVHQAINHQNINGAAPGQSFTIQDVTSRLGVKGEEDLGGGLKAVFAYEFGVDSDLVNAAPLVTRHAYAGLAGSYGTLVIGSQDGGNLSQAPLYNQAQNVAYSVSNNGGVLATVGAATTGIARTQRVSNAIGYEVKVAGVQLNARHALTGADNAGTPGATPATFENGTRSTEVAATYKLGAFTLGAGAEFSSQNGPDPVATNGRDRLFQVVGEYDFGVAKASLIYGSQKIFAAAGADDTRNDYRVSGWIPLTSNAGIVASYASAEQIANGALDVDVIQLASYYDFSKRTRAYVGINQRNTEAAAPAADVKVRDVSIGLRHNF